MGIRHVLPTRLLSALALLSACAPSAPGTAPDDARLQAAPRSFGLEVAPGIIAGSHWWAQPLKGEEIAPISADGTTVPPASDILDASRNLWTLTAGGQIARDGITDPVTANVTLLLYHGGAVYQQATAGDWWSWSGTGWTSLGPNDPRAAPASGACGSANGATTASGPATGLCSAGAATVVSGSGPWTWTCSGANGGAAAACATSAASGVATLFVSSSTGSDSNPGSAGAPLATLTAASGLVQPGDIVEVAAGTYGPFSISTSGVQGAPIVFRAAAGARPLIHVTGDWWAGIQVAASFIVIEGFEVVGDALSQTLAGAQSGESDTDPTYNAGGITVGQTGQTTITHHVQVIDNVVHDTPAGGISSATSDYITFEGNLVYGTAHYSPYGESGISVYTSTDIDDDTTDYKNIVSGNIVHDNYQLIPTHNSGGILTDGEGIIIDDNHDDQIGGTPYQGRTLVVNNLAYLNGGPGLLAFDDSNVDIFFNTTYENGRSGQDPYEARADDASATITVENNVLYAAAGGQTEGVTNSPGTTWNDNVLFGGSSAPLGANDLVADPLFVDAGAGDFHLSTGSPAVGAANPAIPDAVDLDGDPRSSSLGVAGAYVE